MNTTLRMPHVLHIKLKEAAAAKGISMNALILSLLWDWQEQTKKPPGSAEEVS